MIELTRRQARGIDMGTPDYVRVIDAINTKIDTGEWPPGQQLPKIRELAEMFGTGQTSVKTALAILRREGRVRGQQGKATYVADQPGQCP